MSRSCGRAFLKASMRTFWSRRRARQSRPAGLLDLPKNALELGLVEGAHGARRYEPVLRGAEDQCRGGLVIGGVDGDHAIVWTHRPKHGRDFATGLLGRGAERIG